MPPARGARALAYVYYFTVADEGTHLRLPTRVGLQGRTRAGGAARGRYGRVGSVRQGVRTRTAETCGPKYERGVMGAGKIGEVGAI